MAAFERLPPMLQAMLVEQLEHLVEHLADSFPLFATLSPADQEAALRASPLAEAWFSMLKELMRPPRKKST
jgi:hypothetical protein